MLLTGRPFWQGRRSALYARPVTTRARDERRASHVPGYRGFGGIYAGTASLAHLLTHHGRPVGEGALLALAGGVGFSYNVYPGPWGVHVALGFDVPAGAGVLARTACERLGVVARVDETGNAAVAERSLLETLEEGRPALLWGARGRLPWYRLRDELVPLVPHQWLAVGYEPETDEVLVADLAPGPLRSPRETLAAARQSLFSAKHRRMTIQDTAAPADMAIAARRGLRAGVETYKVPLLPGQGLPGLARWADLLVDTEDARGWPRLFAPGNGPNLYDALLSVFEAIELTTGGGALRSLLAHYLDRAGADELAERYRSLADGWSALAHAAMPAEVPQLARARRLLSERDRRLREAGAQALPEIRRIDRDLTTLRQRAEAAPILTQPETEELRGELSGRVLDLFRAERAAAEELTEWLAL